MSHDKAFIRSFSVVLAILIAAAVIFYMVAAMVTSNLGGEASNERVQTKILENISPVGQVNVGVVPAGAAAGAAGAAAEARSGEQVYNTACMACHSVGVAGAPKTGDKAAWTARAEKGVDGLLQTVTNGINAMPPKGTCADCSADELKAAIVYMLGQAGL